VNEALRQKLICICESVDINNDGQYRLFGSDLVTPTPDAQTDQTQREAFKLSLRDLLYFHCYSRTFTGTLHRSPLDQPEYDADAEFVDKLQTSNPCRYFWDTDWEIFRKSENGEIQVRKGERFRAAKPGEYAFTSGPNVLMDVGSKVNLQVLRDSFLIQPGMYFVFGDTLDDRFDSYETVRFYFNIHPQAAPNLLSHLATRFNRFQIPFYLKVQQEPANFDRLDPFVVYLTRRYYQIVLRLLSQLPDDITQALGTDVPLFSKKLIDGVGLAEAPGSQRSFGQNRCVLIAEGLIEAWENNVQSAEEKLKLIEQKFVENQYSLETPHLCRSDTDIYQFPEDVTVDLPATSHST